MHNADAPLDGKAVAKHLEPGRDGVRLDVSSGGSRSNSTKTCSNNDHKSRKSADGNEPCNIGLVGSGHARFTNGGRNDEGGTPSHGDAGGAVEVPDRLAPEELTCPATMRQERYDRAGSDARASSSFPLSIPPTRAASDPHFAGRGLHGDGGDADGDVHPGGRVGLRVRGGASDGYGSNDGCVKERASSVEPDEARKARTRTHRHDDDRGRGNTSIRLEEMDEDMIDRVISASVQREGNDAGVSLGERKQRGIKGGMPLDRTRQLRQKAVSSLSTYQTTGSQSATTTVVNTTVETGVEQAVAGLQTRMNHLNVYAASESSRRVEAEGRVSDLAAEVQALKDRYAAETAARAAAESNAKQYMGLFKEARAAWCNTQGIVATKERALVEAEERIAPEIDWIDLKARLANAKKEKEREREQSVALQSALEACLASGSNPPDADTHDPESPVTASTVKSNDTERRIRNSSRSSKADLEKAAKEKVARMVEAIVPTGYKKEDIYNDHQDSLKTSVLSAPRRGRIEGKAVMTAVPTAVPAGAVPMAANAAPRHEHQRDRCQEGQRERMSKNPADASEILSGSSSASCVDDFTDLEVRGAETPSSFPSPSASSPFADLLDEGRAGLVDVESGRKREDEQEPDELSDASRAVCLRSTASGEIGVSSPLSSPVVGGVCLHSPANGDIGVSSSPLSSPVVGAALQECTDAAPDDTGERLDAREGKAFEIENTENVRDEVGAFSIEQKTGLSVILEVDDAESSSSSSSSSSGIRSSRSSRSDIHDRSHDVSPESTPRAGGGTPDVVVDKDKIDDSFACSDAGVSSSDMACDNSDTGSSPHIKEEEGIHASRQELAPSPANKEVKRDAEALDRKHDIRQRAAGRRSGRGGDRTLASYVLTSVLAAAAAAAVTLPPAPVSLRKAQTSLERGRQSSTDDGGASPPAADAVNPADAADALTARADVRDGARDVRVDDAVMTGAQAMLIALESGRYREELRTIRVGNGTIKALTATGRSREEEAFIVAHESEEGIDGLLDILGSSRPSWEQRAGTLATASLAKSVRC